MTYDTVDITVHRPTNAQFTQSSTNVCLGDDITFTNQSLGENLTYEWDFGNGNTSTAAGPHTINYASPGTYAIQLVADGYCGSDTAEQTVIVNPLTVADFAPLDPIEGCSPMTVSFENNSTGANLSYNWTVDGNPAGNTEDLGPLNFTETPGNNPVNYDIELTVNSACGTETMQTTVIVHRPTEANMSVVPTEVCLGEEITATDLSLGENLTYEWDFGDGNTSTTQGPHVLNYTNDGTFDIQLIADGYCGPDTIVTPVTVNPFPVADFSPDLPDGCVALDMTFTNNSTPSASQSWNFGGNATPATSTNYNPGTITFPTVGTEMIVLEVEENGCVSTDTNYIEVFPLPVIDFDLTPDEGCSDLEVVITNNSVDNGFEDFEWDLGNGSNFNGYNPPDQNYIALTNDSIYDIQLNVISGSGCEDSLTHQVTVHPVPVANFDFIEDSICLNTSLSVNNLSTVGMNYEWDFGDGNTSTAVNPTHQYGTDGTYMVSLIVNSPFNCADTIEREITVHPIPTPQFTNTTECLGYETIFTDNSTGNIIEWSWNFGDGNTSTQQNPVYEYGSAGTFNTILTIENNFNCFTSISQNVNVNDVPVADFSASEFCLGDDTEFTDLTTGATTQLEWDFDDGSPVNNNNNPTNIFPSVGDYDVQLVAFGGSGCSDTIVQTITITEVPIADFSFQTACTNDTTFFTDLSTGNPDTYVWDFGDGNTDNTNNLNPSHVYNTPGTYNVNLTVAYTASGCSNSISYSVDAHPRTEPQFTANTPCFGSETGFLDQTTNTPTLWEWDFDDGSPISTAQNPNHEYTAPGLYDVSLITENVFGCSDTVIQTVEVFELPTPGFEFDTVCLNEPTTFVDQSANAVAWEYNFDDGNTSTNANPSHLFQSDGTYNVVQVVTNNEGCTDTLTRDVIVRPNPEAIWEADTACYSYVTSFTDNSVDAVSWQWELGDAGATSNNQNPQLIYGSDGTFSVELIVENIYGCSDTLIEDVLVLPQPEADFENATVCARDEVDFINNSLGAPTQYSWDFGDGSPIDNTENPTHTFSTGGMYDVTLIAENAVGCADTLEETIEVFTVPDVDFEADTVCLFDVTNFTDLSQDATPLLSWDWDFGDGNTSFQQNPTYIYQNFGVYDVSLTVTNINGCDSTINHDVIVSEVPVADFTVDTDCFGAPTIFTDQSTNNPGIWLWDFGDGNTLNGGPNETHTYASPGNYVVSLSVSSSDSVCSDQMSQVITIAQEAQADFFVPTQICATEVFNFTDNSSANLGTISNYNWDMDDGTSYNTANGSHNYTSSGIYDVTLTITTTDGCQSTYTESIEVLPITEANFDWSLACENQSLLFTNTSTGNTTDWFWDFGDGNVSSLQFPEHTFDSEGNYDVMLIVQNLAGCSDTIIQTVTVHPLPTPNFTNDIVCYGSETNFTDQSTISSGTIDEWNWNFGNGEGSSTVTHPEYAFNNYTDTHDVTLWVISDQGCSDTITKNVTLLPIVNFEIDLEEMNGCAPMEVVFENQSTTSGNAEIIGYTWYFGDGTTSFNESPVHIFEEEGEYPVTLTVSTSTDCQFSNVGDILINVFPTPTAGFDINPTITTIVEPEITITDQSLGASQWEYDFGDGFYSNASSLDYTYDEVGDFEIIQYVKNEFDCIDTAIRAVRIQDDFTFYVPNSFTPDGDGRNDDFRWVVDGHETFSLRIFNRWGEEVFSTTDPYATWNGYYMGEVVKDGVYVWQAKITDLKDEEHLVTGHLTVLR
ncbi:MAG: PKD domain-containing protein [Brumimicrobium sp.]